MTSMYVYLTMLHADCEDFEEEYLVGFSEDVGWEYGQREANAGLYDYINEYQSFYFDRLGIEDPTEEDVSEYEEQCVMFWWPMTEKMSVAMMRDCEILDDEDGIIIIDFYDNNEEEDD